MSNVKRCYNCGHASIVKSNFKGLSDGRFYCNSVKRPKCEEARLAELKYEATRNLNSPKYNPIEGWR